jgi:diguanylate cyclase (GGDEF)-like protein
MKSAEIREVDRDERTAIGHGESHQPAERAEAVSVNDASTSHGSRVVVAAAVGLFGFYLVWQLAGPGRAGQTTLVGNAVFVLANLLAVFAAVAAMRRCRAETLRYRSWAFIAFALVLYLLGHFLQGYQDFVRQLPDTADAEDALFYGCLFVGLLGFAASRRNVVRRWQFALDTVTIALGSAAVLWYVIAGRLAGGRQPVHVIVDALIYPLGDLILLLAVVRTLQRGVKSTSKRSMQTIAVGIMVYVFADTWAGYLGVSGTQSGNRIDVATMATTTLFCVAGALQQRVSATEDRPIAGSTGSSWITYGAAAAVFSLIFVIERHQPFFPNLSIVGAAVIIAILVTASQFLGQRALGDERQKNEGLVEELRHRAFHDDLTGLANRALFNERLEHALARRRANSARHAVLMVDLDGFKSVNDSLGRVAGDELLQTMSVRLLGAVRRGDTVARTGGDEFALLLEDVGDENDAIEVVEHVLDAIRVPLDIGGKRLVPGASVGVALTEDEPSSADELMRYADTAMYLAKQENFTHYRVFESAMQTALAERVELEADLTGAAGRGELRVYYQPILSLASMEVVGFEALVRWMHPVRGLLQPAAFIPLAESCGLIHEIDTWVLFEAIAQASRWRIEFPTLGDLSVHVNLSPLQLSEPDLITTVASALAGASFEPRLLTLELVESSVVDDLELANVRLTELKALGVRIALDDFGTGYSSLSHLRSLPIDELKIDRSFIATMEDSVQANTLVCSLIQLGEALGIDTVAEGIEAAGQLLRLQEENCLLGQGYLFAKPLDHDRLQDYLRTKSSVLSGASSPR